MYRQKIYHNNLLNNTVMSTTLYNIALVTHVIGITVMAGTTFIDFITLRAFSILLKTDRDKALVLENYLYKLQRFLGIGMLLILVSGVTMMIKIARSMGSTTLVQDKNGCFVAYHY